MSVYVPIVSFFIVGDTVTSTRQRLTVTRLKAATPIKSYLILQHPPSEQQINIFIHQPETFKTSRTLNDVQLHNILVEGAIGCSKCIKPHFCLPQHWPALKLKTKCE